MLEEKSKMADQDQEMNGNGQESQDQNGGDQNGAEGSNVRDDDR